MAAIITLGDEAATSADFTLADAASASISLFCDEDNALPPRAHAVVEYKGSDNNYYWLATITGRRPMLKLAQAGTFRVRKAALADQPYGVDKV